MVEILFTGMWIALVFVIIPFFWFQTVKHELFVFLLFHLLYFGSLCPFSTFSRFFYVIIFLIFFWSFRLSFSGISYRRNVGWRIYCHALSVDDLPIARCFYANAIQRSRNAMVVGSSSELDSDVGLNCETATVNPSVSLGERPSVAISHPVIYIWKPSIKEESNHLRKILRISSEI